MSKLHVGMMVGRSRLEYYGSADRWRLRCHCGAEAWRAAASIRQAIREGRGVHCDACAAAIRRAAGAASLDRAWRTKGTVAP